LRKLLEFCTARNIHLMAYCPLTRGDKLNHPVVSAVAGKHGKTPAQVLLRWALQHAIAVIPKSSRTARITENAALYDFSLDPADMRRLDGLDEDYRTCWDPTHVR